jgi:hypothetical protein
METQEKPGFVVEAFSSIENLLKYADVLLQSGKLPKHFYELDKTYQYSKDAEGRYVVNKNLLVAVIQFGLDMGLSVSNSIRHLIPLGGTIALKGDMAKAMIFASGKVKSWKQSYSGSYENNDIEYTITAERTDGVAMSYTFRAEDALRMGLWVTPQMAEKHEYFKRSPWYKTPERMCMYRCLGFLSRDLFADVLNGVYLAEEAADLEEDNTQYKTETGMVIKPEKEEKVSKSNSKEVDKIKTRSEKLDKIANSQPAVEQPKEDEQPTQLLFPEQNLGTEQQEQSETGPELSVEGYAGMVKKMSPMELVNEFALTMPFTIDKWVKAGGKKDARTIVPLLIANYGNGLQKEVELRGVDWNLVNA